MPKKTNILLVLATNINIRSTKCKPSLDPEVFKFTISELKPKVLFKQ